MDWILLLHPHFQDAFIEDMSQPLLIKIALNIFMENRRMNVILLLEQATYLWDLYFLWSTLKVTLKTKKSVEKVRQYKQTWLFLLN